MFDKFKRTLKTEPRIVNINSQLEDDHEILSAIPKPLTLIMDYVRRFILISTTLLLYSCNRSKEIPINNYDGLKFLVSTNYDSFEETETYYYELKTKTDSIIIGKTWCLATGYKDYDLTKFSGEKVDSIVYLKFLNGVIVAYDLENKHELTYKEIKKTDLIQ